MLGKFFNEAVGLVSDFKSVTVDFKCEELEVHADSLLKRLLHNLLDNTLKYGGKVHWWKAGKKASAQG